MNIKHSYRQGEYAYLSTVGEIVRILGSTSKDGIFGTKYYIQVESLKDVDPITNKADRYYECSAKVLFPIKDSDVQLFFRMLYSAQEFNTLRVL